MNHGIYGQALSDSLSIAAEAVIADHVMGKRRRLCVASVSCYGACLADGSEYTASYSKYMSVADLEAFHDERCREMMGTSNGSMDIFGCETIPCLVEVRALVHVLTRLQTPAWISFACCDDSHLNSGESVVEAIQLADGCSAVVAVGFNCTAPENILGLIKLHLSILKNLF